MKRIGKRLAALMLAACLLLGLAACGGEDSGGGKGRDKDSEAISGTVYVPAFTDVTTDAEYIYQGCISGDYMYFLGNVQGEEHEESYTWEDEKGEEHTETYTYYDYTTALFRVPLTGGAAEKLNFKESEIPEGSDGGVDISDLRPGEDGTLWVTENMYIQIYDLPEGFDETTDDKWNYYVDSQNTQTMHQLDAEGNVLASVDITDLAEKAEMDWFNSYILDGAGNIYINSDMKIAVLDKDMNLIFSLEGENMWGEMVLLSDGSVGLCASYYDEEKETSGYRMRTIDPESQDWGETYELSQNSYNVYPGGGDYLFYYRNNSSIYGLNARTGEGEKVFSWISADINENEVQFFSFLADGRVAAMLRDWSGENPTYELATLVPTDASTLPKKTTLTYACMGLGWDIRNKIIEFNKSSDLYRIEVTDYRELNTGEDASAGLTKMNTEILAGHVPDILDAGSSMPISQYGTKGILEDLWPFIEKDTEIGGRDGVMENVLKAAEQDGKLYRVFSLFDIRTVVGASRIVGDRTTWTLSDLKAALAQMPEGCTIFGISDTKEGMLNTILSCNMDSFVDWSTGACYFDSDSFKSLLEFCNSFPADFDWDSFDWDEWEEETERIMGGKQMLLNQYLDNFTSPQYFRAMFGGDISYVGYPMEDGSVGSAFQLMGLSLAMSSTCKDKEGAWSFIRQLLLPSYSLEEDGTRYLYDFPVNKQDFEAFMTDSMTEIYLLDDNGQQIIDEETGEPMKESRNTYWLQNPDGTEEWVEVYAAEQKDVDQIMALYNSITNIWTYDTSIYDIIQEHAGGYFAGDRSVEDTVSRIQSAVKLYIGEQM